MASAFPIEKLGPFEEPVDEINVIIECPKGTGNKYAYEPAVFTA